MGIFHIVLEEWMLKMEKKVDSPLRKYLKEKPRKRREYKKAFRKLLRELDDAADFAWLIEIAPDDAKPESIEGLKRDTNKKLERVHEDLNSLMDKIFADIRSYKEKIK